MAAGAGGVVLPRTAMAAGSRPAQPGPGPYGPVSDTPDENGLHLPEGFTSRIVGVAGEPVGDTGYRWHAYPDGAATFPTDDGGWIHVCNSEVFPWVAPDAGGVSAVVYASDGRITDAYRILEGSNSNCAGGPTPWGTWLSCEESPDEQGRVFECDPSGARDAVELPALGRWSHEAVAVDPDGEALYLTEDHPGGLLYRFTPRSYPSLDEGVLEACVVAEDGSVSWREVPDPSGAERRTREQVEGATVFPGGEGAWYHDGVVVFTTKFDNTVHALHVADQRHEIVFRSAPADPAGTPSALSGVDNVTVDAGSGDVYVAEDGGNMEVVVITPEGEVTPFVRIAGSEHDGSEVTGPCFNPARDRLYVSSQRGPSPSRVADIVPGASVEDRAGGVTYEITGPFRGVAAPEEPVSPSTTLARAAGDGPGDDDDATPLVVGGALAVAAAAGAGLLAVRNRRRGA